MRPPRIKKRRLAMFLALVVAASLYSLDPSTLDQSWLMPVLGWETSEILWQRLSKFPEEIQKRRLTGIMPSIRQNPWFCGFSTDQNLSFPYLTDEMCNEPKERQLFEKWFRQLQTGERQDKKGTSITKEDLKRSPIRVKSMERSITMPGGVQEP